MKKITVAVLAVLITGSMASAEGINVVGTGAGMGVLKEIGADFMKVTPNVQIVVPASIGSGGGITAVGKDQEKLGRVSRKLKDTESSLGLTYVEIAKLPIVFYVNRGVGVKKLTTAQILDIYTGKTKNWKAVGGTDLPIIVMRREKGDSSLEVLTSLITGFSDETITKEAVTLLTDTEATARAEVTPGAIGFGTLANAAAAKLDALTMDNVEPTSPGYKYLGALALIYKNANYMGNIKAFIDFAASKKANPAIARAFCIPVY